jgi:hypothetical protein
VAETRIAEQGGAYTLAIIGIGSVVEGLLLALLLENDSQLRQNGFVDKHGKRVTPERAGMELLIETAHSTGWIQLDAKDFMHTPCGISGTSCIHEKNGPNSRISTMTACVFAGHRCMRC